ncbi:MAG: hypothetical protein RIS35_3306 [Pseudomonadota bacterium]
MPPSAPRHALGWLERQPEFQALTDRASRLLALQTDLRQCAPARGLTALGLEDDTLVAGTAGAAAAAKLRQLEPTIIAHLAQRGWNVRRIRFRPLPIGAIAPPVPIEPKAPIPASALEAFRSLAESASNPGLKAAVGALLRHRLRG